MILNRSNASLELEMAGHRRDAIGKINKMVGETRLEFITDLPGQEATYLAKEQEAAAFLSADPEPTDLTDYQFIEQEMIATGWTAHATAQTLANMAHYWRLLAAQLEGLRRGYIVQVEAASTQPEIDVLVDDLKASLRAISGA